MQAAPNSEGTVWVSMGDQGGLWKSSDFGLSFSIVSSVSYSLLFCFGKNEPGVEGPAVYVMGTVKGIQSVFVSSDLGNSWQGIIINNYDYN